MIKAVLQGKSKGYEYLEDVLTSTIFGTLNYLPLNKVLIPFIENALLHSSKTRLWEILKSQGIELRAYQSVKMHFWVKHSKYGEPDLILLFTDHVHNEQDLLLVVEAKFKSDKSGTGDYDQLMRYYRAINEDLSGFYEEEVSEFKGLKGYIIYLTERDAVDEIKASEIAIRKIDDNYSNSIFYLRWHNLHRILRGNWTTLALKEKVIAEDIICYLDRLGLGAYCGISLPNRGIINAIKIKGSIFYRNESYFKYLPKLNLVSKEYCFYKGDK